MERLQRILAGRGVASRRLAEQLIRDGRVSVDGRVVTELGTKADPVRSDIRVDGKLLRRQRSRYILLNKPRGYITTTKDERDRRTVLDLVQVSERIYPVGRLDRVTEGLLLLTNDGDVANRVMHPSFGLEKEYEVLTPSRPSDATFDRVRKGIALDGKQVVPNEFRILRESREGILLKIVIHEGIFHVVRRMMEAVGIEVTRLRRVRIGPLSVTGIPVGTWRELRPGEERTLFEALGLGREEGEEDRMTRSARRGYGAPADEDLYRGPKHGTPTKQSDDKSRDKSKRGGNGQHTQEPGGRSDRRPRGGSVPPGDRDRRPGRGRQDNRRPRRGGPARRDAL